MSLELGATLGELLRGGAKRVSAAREAGGGRVSHADLPPPGGGGAASHAEGDGARAEQGPGPTAAPGGSWWPAWGARHADEADDDEQPERDELRRRARMK